MSSSTRNVKLGICKIFFDGVDLGYTKGGVEVSVSTETYKVEVDQFGKTAINELIQGRQASVTCPLAETTLSNLIATMPGASLVSDGVRASGLLTFTANPTTTTSTVTVGAQLFTFVAATPTGPTQVKVGTTLAATLENLINTLNSYQWASGSAVANAGGIQVDLSSANVLRVRAVDPGVLGNSIQINGTAGANVTPTTATALSGGVAETRSRVDVGTGAGIDMLSIAKQLRLHPTTKADNDFSDDFIMYRAAAAGALQFAYQVDAERVYNVTFNAYPDPSSINSRMFSVGDPFYQP